MNSIRKIINKPCLLVNKLNVRKQRIWYIERPEENAVCSAEFVPLWSTRADLRFVKNVVLGKRFSQYLEECSSGSSNSQKRVTPDTIVDAIVELPEVAEQKAIGDYLSNLDHLITTQQRKLETLKRLKRFMLQNLFV